MKPTDTFVADITVSEVSAGHVGGWRLQQTLVELSLSPGQRREQVALVELVSTRRLRLSAQGDPRAVGKHLHGFAKFQALGPHDKAEHVAADVADPTFERLPIGIHLETGPRIVVPGAEADKVAPLSAQGHVTPHEIDDVDRLANLFLGILQIVERHGKSSLVCRITVTPLDDECVDSGRVLFSPAACGGFNILEEQRGASSAAKYQSKSAFGRAATVTLTVNSRVPRPS